jgi:hypothetical protein
MRQTDLLSGAAWDSLYRAFPRINFNATDPNSLSDALGAFLRQTRPEDFNDWIVSSEFVAIIDLLSYLAGTLAFRTDIAVRENFLDTAEARESILRLARFLSYNPSRCVAANGLLKIVQVATDDDVVDSFGASLSNIPVLWNDSNNPNWFEQFTLVLNNAFSSTNPFGVPLATSAVGGVTTQLYRINGLASAASLGFSTTVSGASMDFEICNGLINDDGGVEERTPNPANAMQLFYLNDGNGNSSARTGFFLLFRQGTTSKQTFNIPVPVQNQIIDINAGNINQSDVWVATVDDFSNVIIDWTQVESSNITYNTIAAANRNIYSVITRDNDQISVRFSDGNFGAAPVGNIQVSYRVSNGLSYAIQPSEINNLTVTFPYTNLSGMARTLTVTFSLFETVANATTAETIDQIRQRAPQVYATQNRMVSGEDYNTFPLSKNIAVKIKAVNRVYSGQSRYFDLHDPTGTYRDLTLLADDGIFFRDTADTYFEIPTALNRTAEQLYNDYIQPSIDQFTTANLIRDVLMQNVLNGTIAVPQSANGPYWTPASNSLYSTTGWFSYDFAQVTNLLQPGAIIQFNIAGTLTWVAVLEITSNATTTAAPNSAGPVTLAQSVPAGASVVRLLPAAVTVLSPDVSSVIVNNLNKRISFSVWYDYAANGGRWVVNSPQSDFGQSEPALVGTQLLIMTVNFIAGLWRINSRGLRYVFESLQSVQWFDDGNRALAQLTGEVQPDTVRILRTNANVHSDPASHGFPLDKAYDLTIDRLWSYPDGTPETRRTTVMLADSDGDGAPDQPDLFYKILSDVSINTYLFWSNTTNPPYDDPLYTVIGYDTDLLRSADTGQAIGTVGFQLVSTSSPVLNHSFWVMTATGWQLDRTSYRMQRGRGPNTASAWVTSAGGTVMPFGDQISFQWKHYAKADHRINPASTNIIDIFVLTKAYDTAVRQWIANGAKLLDSPVPPTELELSVNLASLESQKIFSDTIVWRPVKYKYLFGASADPSVQAQFKVVRLANSSVSDGAIQSKMLAAINAFFAVEKWNFGEEFYFTELAAYIHQQLVGLISSVVLVPRAANAAFGDGFEISCREDEIFISTAQIADIVLINSNTAVNLRMV